MKHKRPQFKTTYTDKEILFEYIKALEFYCDQLEKECDTLEENLSTQEEEMIQLRNDLGEVEMSLSHYEKYDR